MLDLTCFAFVMFTATDVLLRLSSILRSLWASALTACKRQFEMYSPPCSQFYFFVIYFFLMSLSPASFYGDGFVQLKATESTDHNTLHIRFRTSSTNGLLFLAAGQTDYFLLELHAGRLQVGTSMAPAHEHMCSSIHEHTHTYIYKHAGHTDLYAWPHARVWKDTHTDHLKLLLYLSWQCQSLNTVTQADKPVWCELSVDSIPFTCHSGNKDFWCIWVIE